jgi:cytochrome c oxidase subunit IV
MSNPAHPQVGHVVPLRVLFAVLGTLLVMTVVTVAVSWFDFGRYNLWIALAIAVFKASLVLLFFMHLKYDKPFNAIVIIVSMALVMLFIAIALTDTAQYEPNRIPGYAPSIKTNPK